MPRVKQSVTQKVDAADAAVNALESTEEAIEVVQPEAITSGNVNRGNITPSAPKTMEDLVDQVIENVRGYGAKFNKTRTLAVVDLASKGAQQGVTYRQLHIQADQGYMSVSLRETFKSSHGGQEQTKVLSSFSIPVYETKSFSKLQSRFFGYSTTKNVDEGVLLLDNLRKTVSK